MAEGRLDQWYPEVSLVTTDTSVKPFEEAPGDRSPSQQRDIGKFGNSLMSVLCVLTGLYYLYVDFFAGAAVLAHRGPIVAIGLVMAFIYYPLKKGARSRWIFAIDCGLAVLAVLSIAWAIRLSVMTEEYYLPPYL